MIGVIKGIFSVVLFIVVLNEGMTIMEKHADCKDLRRRALYSLLPGKPCSDFETRAQLEGEFLKCKDAEKVAASHVISCAVTRWLDGWLPSRIMTVVNENFLVSVGFALVIIIAGLYFTTAAVINDRADERRMNLLIASRGYYPEPRNHHGRTIKAGPCENNFNYISNGHRNGRITVEEIHDDDEDFYY